MLIRIIVLSLPLLLSGCGVLYPANGFWGGHSYPAGDVCNVNQAYQMGIADGDRHEPMRSDLGGTCSLERQPEVKKGYEQGYQEGIKSRPEYLPRDAGQQREPRGYSQRTRYTAPAHTSASTLAKPDEQCMRTMSGQVCGYHCVKSFDTVKCASSRTDNCVKDAQGRIKCGKNCRIEGTGQIACDVER